MNVRILAIYSYYNNPQHPRLHLRLKRKSQLRAAKASLWRNVHDNIVAARVINCRSQENWNTETKCKYAERWISERR